MILGLIVLPGGLSLVASHLYSPRDSNRSIVVQWGMLVYHAAVIHLISIIAVVVPTLLGSDFFFGTLALDRLLSDGVREYVKDDTEFRFMMFGAYALLLMIGATLSGVIDLPSQITEAISWCARKCKLAGDPVSEVPLWYKAWRSERERMKKPNVQLLVRMKNGDIYIGMLYDYQFIPHPDGSRDVILGSDSNVWMRPGGNTSKEYELYFDEGGGGGVMLNSANISSIEYLYHGENEDDD